MDLLSTFTGVIAHSCTCSPRRTTEYWQMNGCIKVLCPKSCVVCLFRWTPVCWGALGCWTRPLSSAALRRTRFLQCSQRPRAPRITWSSLVSSGPPTATSSWWLTTARSTASWSKPHIPTSDLDLDQSFYSEKGYFNFSSQNLYWVPQLRKSKKYEGIKLQLSKTRVKTQLRFRFGLDGLFVLSPIVMEFTQHI